MQFDRLAWLYRHAVFVGDEPLMHRLAPVLRRDRALSRQADTLIADLPRRSTLGSVAEREALAPLVERLVREYDRSR